MSERAEFSLEFLERRKTDHWKQDPKFSEVYKYLCEEKDSEIFTLKVEEVELLISDVGLERKLEGKCI